MGSEGAADPGSTAAARARFERTPASRLASGPGLVGAAFGIDTTWTGTDLCAPASLLRLEMPPSAEPLAAVVTTARIGVAYAADGWAERPWRFALAGHPSVSAGTRQG